MNGMSSLLQLVEQVPGLFTSSVSNPSVRRHDYGSSWHSGAGGLQTGRRQSRRAVRYGPMMVGQRHQRARFSEGFRFEQKIVRRGDREEVGITSAGGFGDRRSECG
jgi:hypothetical protein